MLVGMGIKRVEELSGAGRVKSERLREQHYKEEYARYLERKIVDWVEATSVEQMCEEVKRAMADAVREREPKD